MYLLRQHMGVKSISELPVKLLGHLWISKQHLKCPGMSSRITM